MTTFLDNNKFAISYSARRASRLSSSLDPDWQDGNVCIDSIRNALFEAGWLFVNPYRTAPFPSGSPIPLGSASLASAYAAGQGYMELNLEEDGIGTGDFTLLSLPHIYDSGTHVTTPLRFLLNTGIALYQFYSGAADQTNSYPALLPISSSCTLSGVARPLRCFVTCVAGRDVDLPACFTLSQVRGLSASAQGVFTTGFFQLNQFFWWCDHAGDSTVITAVLPNACIPATRYGPVTTSGGRKIRSFHIDDFVAAFNSTSCGLYGTLGRFWKCRQEHPDLDGAGTFPGTDTFLHLDWVAAIGRDSGTGLLDGTADMSGTIGNNPVVFCDFFDMPGLSGAIPGQGASGGGWVMTNPTADITVAIRQTVYGGYDILFQFADSRSSIDYHPFFYGIVKHAVEYTLLGGNTYPFPPRVHPVYRTVANSRGFAIVDTINPPDLAQSQLLAVSPHLLQEQIDGGATKSVLIVGPSNLNLGLVWYNSLCSVSIDGAPFSTFKASGPSIPGVVTAAFGFSVPLLTSNNRAFLENAWVMFAGSTDAESQIQGRVTDAIMLTEPGIIGQSFLLDGHTFYCVCSQDGSPAASLWMAGD